MFSCFTVFYGSGECWTDYTLLGFAPDYRERVESGAYYGGPGAEYCRDTIFTFHPFIGWVAQTDGGLDV